MIKHKIIELIQDALSKIGIHESIELEHPTNTSFGDYSTNIALKLAKTHKKNPFEIAETIAGAINTESTIEKVEIVKPGFINFYLSKNILLKELNEILEKNSKYGQTITGVGKKWLIEHTSPNPNKAMHLGHLRNNVTGMAISNLWEATGIKVIRDCIDNNRGIAIARLMWGYLKFAHKKGEQITDINYWYDHQDEWNMPQDVCLSADKFVDHLYVKASEDFKNKEIETIVRQMVVNWEQGDERNHALWKKVLDLSYQGQNETYKRLKNQFDKVWHEHEHYKQGKDLVEEGLKKGVFKRLEDGAILSNLDKYKLPDTIIIKKDGTSLYLTQDLALTKLKKEVFSPDKLFWVVGPDQTLALRQLFAICEQLGIAKREDLIHISFGYMSIKGKGKMSSRAGNVVYIEDLLDDAKAEILKMFDERKFASGNIEEVAEKMAVGAVKYSILKVGRTTDTAFNFETSLSLEGDSGPYIQYTYARCQSVLSQGSTDVADTPQSVTPNEEELSLLRLFPRFIEAIEAAAMQYAPNLLCNYLFTLAQAYNLFYQKHQILKADEETKKFRLTLTQSAAQVLKNGLAILGIETVEKI